MADLKGCVAGGTHVATMARHRQHVFVRLRTHELAGGHRAGAVACTVCSGHVVDLEMMDFGNYSVTWLLGRLQEPSSYSGLAGLMASVHLSTDPGLIHNITLACTGLS